MVLVYTNSTSKMGAREVVKFKDATGWKIIGGAYSIQKEGDVPVAEFPAQSVCYVTYGEEPAAKKG